MSTIISPANVNFTRCNGLAIYRGSFWEVPVTISTRENLVDTPVDLTGFVGSCAIKLHTGDDTPVATPEVSISATTTGLFTLSLSSSLSQNIPTTGRDFEETNTMYYEVQLTDTTSQESYRALYGEVEIIPAVLDADDNE